MHKPRNTPQPEQSRAQDPAAPKSVPQASHSGQVQFDSRGNAVWEWRTETGQFTTDISTQRLKKLVDSDLALDETGKVKKVDELSLDDTRSGKGFNPYNHAKSQPTSPNPYKKQYASAASTATPTQPRKPIKDLRAYSEWLAMKKRLEDQKDDD